MAACSKIRRVRRERGILPGKFQRACARRRMDERWQNHKGGTEHGRRIELEGGESARRTKTKCLAALGIPLANARSAGEPNADCSRNRFTRPNATSAP